MPGMTMGTNPITDPDPRWTEEVHQWAQDTLDTIIAGSGPPVSRGATRRIILELVAGACIVAMALAGGTLGIVGAIGLLAMGLLLAGER